MWDTTDVKRKKVKRSELVRLTLEIASSVRSAEPVDVLLFKLIDDRPVRLVEFSEVVTIGHQRERQTYPIWVSEMHEFDTSFMDESGHVQESMTKCGDFEEYGLNKGPFLIRVPAYTREVEAAVFFKTSILTSSRRLLLAELRYDGLDPGLWDAKILDDAGVTVASAMMESQASAIVLAVLRDLIDNDGASWWIEVINP
jgi:hypothetical protein